MQKGTKHSTPAQLKKGCAISGTQGAEMTQGFVAFFEYCRTKQNDNQNKWLQCYAICYCVRPMYIRLQNTTDKHGVMQDFGEKVATLILN